MSPVEGQESHEWSRECRWPWDPNPELYKLYKIKIKRNYKWNTRQEEQSHSIYMYIRIQYLIMHNFSAAGLPQRRQGRRWLQATAPTATPTPTRLRLWMCLCECALLILIALRMGAQGLTEGSIMTVPLLLCIIMRIGRGGERGHRVGQWWWEGVCLLYASTT